VPFCSQEREIQKRERGRKDARITTPKKGLSEEDGKKGGRTSGAIRVIFPEEKVFRALSRGIIGRK